VKKKAMLMRKRKGEEEEEVAMTWPTVRTEEKRWCGGFVKEFRPPACQKDHYEWTVSPSARPEE
jgi:hypothetical protein